MGLTVSIVQWPLHTWTNRRGYTLKRGWVGRDPVLTLWKSLLPLPTYLPTYLPTHPSIHPSHPYVHLHGATAQCGPSPPAFQVSVILFVGTSQNLYGYSASRKAHKTTNSRTHARLFQCPGSTQARARARTHTHTEIGNAIKPLFC
jgi:hypothetical protein